MLASRIGGLSGVVFVVGLALTWSCSDTERDFGSSDGGGAGEEASGGSEATGAKPSGGSAGEPSAAPLAGETSTGTGGTDQGAGFEIVEVTPADDATGVERDGAIEVTFSHEIDPDSVEQGSLAIQGPNGTVSGKLEVAGETLTFKPDARLALLADYTITVAGVRDAVGATLADERRFTFQTRDGVFGKPQRLTTTQAYLTTVSGTRSGYVVVDWRDKLTPASSYAAVFDPVSAAWGKDTPLETDSVNAYDSVSSSVNESGQTLAILGSSTLGAFNRGVAGSWSGAKSTGIAQARSCILAEDGSAMTMWEDIVASEWRVFAASLSNDDKWGATTTLGTKAREWALARFDSGYIALFAHEPSYQFFYRLYANGTWAAEKPLTPTNVSANYISLATESQTALFTWNGPQSRMQASLFDGTTWATEDLGPVSGGTTARVSGKGHAAAWLNKLNAYVATCDPSGAWADPIKLGATTAEDFGPAIEIDSAGNTLAAWPNGADIDWRRAPGATGEWSEVQQIEDQDPYMVRSTVDALGNVMLIWDNPLGIWASRFE
jgi:hypothetical protein